MQKRVFLGKLYFYLWSTLFIWRTNMLKKIILAAAIAATASFATWDYFPVKESHKGEAKVQFDDMIQDKWQVFTLTTGVRFSPAQNFEFGIALPYMLFYLYDGNKENNANGVEDLETMLRYQFIPNMNAFLDVTVPTANAEQFYPDYPFAFHFGVQYSEKFGIVNFGSELGYKIETRGEDKVSPPNELNAGLEADFEISQVVTPYVGLNLYMLVGKYTYEGENEGKSYTGKLGINPYAGLNIAFNDIVSLDIHGMILTGKDYLEAICYNDKAIITVGTALSANF